jgi:hypothetical protein
MKTLLKLIVVVIVLNGAYRMGMTEYRHSQLTTSTSSILALGTNTPVEEIKAQILKRAADLDLPVSPDGVLVEHEGLRTTIKVSYHRDVEVFPGYKYPRDYSINDEIVALR